MAVWCNKHYEDVLTNTVTQDKGINEWLRVSFLNVDKEIEKKEGQDEIGDLRREQPPAKPPLLQILDQNKSSDPSLQSNEDLNLDSIGCTANVIYVN